MRAPHGLALVLVLHLGTGCATIQHTPKDYDLGEPWPGVTASGPVSVRTGNAPAGRFTIDLPGQSMTIDLQEYTEALAQRVRKALSEQGVATEPEAARVIEVEVVYANILPQMRFHCVVDFTVRTGDGYVRGRQARDKSGNPQKACNAALSRAAFELLGDERVRRYLAGST